MYTFDLNGNRVNIQKEFTKVAPIRKVPVDDKIVNASVDIAKKCDGGPDDVSGAITMFFLVTVVGYLIYDTVRS